MIEALTLRQVKILVECAMSRKGCVAGRSDSAGRSSDDWQRLLDLGYVRKLQPRGMSDYVERFMATEAGELRLTQPSLLAVAEVMGS